MAFTESTRHTATLEAVSGTLEKLPSGNYRVVGAGDFEFDITNITDRLNFIRTALSCAAEFSEVGRVVSEGVMENMGIGPESPYVTHCAVGQVAAKAGAEIISAMVGRGF